MRDGVARRLEGVELVIFDFDGTLADSEALLVELVQASLGELGLEVAVPARAIGRLIGLPLVEVLSTASGLPAAELTQAVKVYRGRADTPEVIARFRLFPGVRETLAALSRSGKRLAIATSKSRAITERILVAVGLDDLVPTVVGGDCVQRGKPDPEAIEQVLARTGCAAERAALVGDTTFDMAMGKGAGVLTIAATYGMHDRGTLATVEPDCFIDDIRELVA